MAPTIFSRQVDPSTTTSQVASGLIVGIFAFVVLLCVLCLCRLKRASKKQSTTPFRVKGIVQPMAVEAGPPRHRASIPTFSRERLTASVVLPEKTITPKLYTCEASDSSSNLAHSPASSISSLRRPPPPNPSSPPPRALSVLNPAHPRHSRASSGFSGYSQNRFPPGLSPRPSLISLASPSQARPVLQSFEPTLPDELALRGGEQLSVLQSFDDGWCIVARETARASRSFLSPGTKSNGDNVDIGLVPAWVFSKPRESIASMRPFRNASLNALRQSIAAREMLTSWSNFA